MMVDRSYRVSFGCAAGFHLALVLFLLFSAQTSHPVLTLEAKNEPGQALPLAQESVIQAVNVDEKQVMAAMNQLKAEREHQQHLEAQRQHQLAVAAQRAEQARRAEQQHLAKLKQEALKLKQEEQKLAQERQQQRLKEEQQLKQLALLKKEQEKHLENMKAEQQKLHQQAIQHLEEQKKQADAQATAAKIAAQQKATTAAVNKLNAAKEAHLAGEVDKYKAMILQSIGRQWILPEHADASMSSQFRIRLAPNGAVLEVTLIRGSGDPLLDRSAQSAIYKASPLPVPTDSATFNLFRDIRLTVRPESVGRG